MQLDQLQMPLYLLLLLRPSGFHMDFMIHFGTNAYTSLFRNEKNRNGKGDITEFLKEYQRQYEQTRKLGYISIPSGNHDISRLNCCRSLAELKVAWAFLLTMPGVPCIYYGDEIGMSHISITKNAQPLSRLGVLSMTQVPFLCIQR